MQRGARGQAPPPSNQGRQNEYFVPREGIDREVITADICRYLGNDALVRPGVYNDQTTGRDHQGYFITAYRNLTTAMIADLKADSARWEQERRKHQSGAVRYENSSIRDMGPRSGGYNQSSAYGASTAGARDNYDAMGGPKYPGNDHPGYSAGTPQQPSYGSGYGAQPSAYGGYGAQPAAYSTGGADSRYASAMGSGTPGGAYNTSTTPSDVTHAAPWIPGASYSAAPSVRDQYAVDMSMTDAPPPRPTPGYTATTASRSAYGNTPQTQPAYGSYQPTVGSSATTYAQQPLDPFAGRGGGYPATTSTGQPFSDSVASPAGNNPGYSPVPSERQQYEAAPSSRSAATPSSTQAQISSSGPTTSRHSERAERERDRDRDRERTRDRDRDSHRDERSDKRHHHYSRR